MIKQRGIADAWLLLIAVLVVSGALWYAYTYVDGKGYDRGVSVQKAADQVEFDRINTERAQQKAEANALYQGAQAAIVVLMGERDKFKHDLEVQDAKNRKATATLTAKYSGLKLRFAATQSPGDRADGGSANGAGADPTGPAGTAIVELPGPLTADLRQFARDADDLKDAYALCFNYATKVK